MGGRCGVRNNIWWVTCLFWTGCLQGHSGGSLSSSLLISWVWGLFIGLQPINSNEDQIKDPKKGNCWTEMTLEGMGELRNSPPEEQLTRGKQRLPILWDRKEGGKNCVITSKPENGVSKLKSLPSEARKLQYLRVRTLKSDRPRLKTYQHVGDVSQVSFLTSAKWDWYYLSYAVVSIKWHNAKFLM